MTQLRGSDQNSTGLSNSYDTERAKIVATAGGGRENGSAQAGRPSTSVRERTLERIRTSVRPYEGTVPVWVYVDPDVYQLELERLFQRSWLFVAHEDEVPQKGDYVTRTMGEQPVIVTRGEDGAVRVLLNVCRHRGMQVVRADLGNTSHFRCSYHGFTYTCTGKLTGVPFQRDAYMEGLDKTEMNLYPARVETYRGLVFANWDQDAEPLSEFLGGMTWYLDILVGRAEMEVVGPPQRWQVPSCWKIPAENFASDAYHTAHTHASIAKIFKIAEPDFGKRGYHVSAGNGHGLGIGIQDDGSPYPHELRAEYEQHLTPDQLDLFDRVKNYHGNVFPNLSFLMPNLVKVDGRFVTTITIRQWQPRGPDKVEVLSWRLVEKHAPDWWKSLSRTAYTQTFGVSGMFEQDDTENWESQTRVASSLMPRADDVTMHYSMGLGRAPLPDFCGPGEVYEGKFNEENSRAFYRRWLQYVLDEPLTSWVGVPSPANSRNSNA
jgi:phenylpropionate dioxygenase-like ring-hydroxylating dioxygenase large terminal subunit